VRLLYNFLTQYCVVLENFRRFRKLLKVQKNRNFDTVEVSGSDTLVPTISRPGTEGQPTDPGRRNGLSFRDSGLEQSMAAKCELCGKGPQFGNNVSHANNKTRRRWDVNLRPVKAVVGGASKRLRVCTSCIKTGKIVKG